MALIKTDANNYWIASNALHIEFNANGNPDYIQASCVSGTQILVYVKDIITYDAGHNYRKWPLQAVPTVFNSSTEKYVYVAIPRSEAVRNALVVFPSEEIDVYGRNANEEQIGSTDYYYIYLQAVITASVIDGVQHNREWKNGKKFDTGYLSTPEAGPTESAWYQYSAVSQVTTFLKDITMSAGHKFLQLFAETIKVVSGGKIVFGAGGEVSKVASYGSVADNEDNEIVTPKYIHDRETDIEQKYLRKDTDDATEHKLTIAEIEAGALDVFGNTVLQGNVRIDGNAQFNTGATFGDYSAGIVGGSGGNIDSDGNAEFDSLIVRETMTVADLCFNRASVVSGSMFEGPCKGKIKSVTQLTATTGKATLELGADDIAGSIMEGDYCWGYWHNISGGNATADSDDLNGSITYKGFTTVYFHIDEVLNSNSTEFTYTLKPNTTAHPFVGMNFGGRGSNKYANRQAFRLSTPSYVAQYAMVSSWNWDNEQHCVRVSGVLDGFESLVGEEENTWNNKIGTIEGNAYIKGNLVQVTSNKRYLYVTQKNNGVIQPESGDALELVVRDGWFQDRTGEFEFVLTVNGEEIGTIERHAESHTFVIEAGADYLSYDNTTIHIEATDEDGTYVVEQDVTEQRIVSQYRLATYKGAVNPGELVEGSFAFDDGSEVLWDDAQAIAEVTAGDTVSCVRKYGNVHTEIGYLYYSLNNGDLEEYIEGAAVDVDTDTTLVTFWWYYDEEQEQFIDKIDVAVVYDGVDGEDGKDAIDIKIFTDTGNLRIEKGGTITLTAYVYKGGEDITDTIPSRLFYWTRTSKNAAADIVWNNKQSHIGVKSITIGDSDIDRTAMFEAHVMDDPNV